jgi:hypothetical protein
MSSDPVRPRDIYVGATKELIQAWCHDYGYKVTGFRVPITNGSEYFLYNRFKPYENAGYNICQGSSDDVYGEGYRLIVEKIQ